MQFLTTSDLRKPKAWRAIRTDKAVVTSHGKPVVLMLPITGEDFEEVLDLFNQVEAMRALARAQADARRADAADLTAAEIDAEIAVARRERKRGGKGRRATHRT